VGRYNGPAVVIDHHGVAHDVHAMLHSRRARRTSWRGSLAGEAPWWDIFQARAPITVRIGDREGTVYVTQPGGVDGLTDVEVTGRGRPPFD
jgi:hypothetical protein